MSVHDIDELSSTGIRVAFHKCCECEEHVLTVYKEYEQYFCIDCLESWIKAIKQVEYRHAK